MVVHAVLGAGALTERFVVAARGGGWAGIRTGAMLVVPLVKRDCLAMLMARWGRGTHYAGFAHCVQTSTAGQMLMRAARAHLAFPLLGTPIWRPAGHPLSPFAPRSVVCGGGSRSAGD